MAALKGALHSTNTKAVMHIKKEESEAKIKTQRWLQEFPSKLREWKRFSGINCSVSMSSVLVLSAAISVLYSSVKKRGKKRSALLKSMFAALRVLSAAGLKRSKARQDW